MQAVVAAIIRTDLPDLDAYRHRLARHPEEWRHLDMLCRVVVTRFYRDKQVFAALTATVLPQLAEGAVTRGEVQLRIWSIGSASGEEPYTLAILWHHLLAPRFPQLRCTIIATEIDSALIERSLRACYAPAVLKNLPQELRDAAFSRNNDHYCLKAHYRATVEFRQQDIRTTLPEESFDLILCRNLAFTYFDEAQQAAILARLSSRLHPGGWLIVGVHERLPATTGHLFALSERLGLYQKRR